MPVLLLLAAAAFIGYKVLNPAPATPANGPIPLASKIAVPTSGGAAIARMYAENQATQDAVSTGVYGDAPTLPGGTSQVHLPPIHGVKTRVLGS
jgi:hypothetical protein